MNPIRIAALLLGLLFSLIAKAAGPALVVVIVIDGLPQEQVVKYRDLYGKGGFQRLLDEGAWFGNAHQAHAVTLTAPGHASVMTGTYPYRHGIIANEWTDRNSLGQVYCTGDPAHTYIGDETKKPRRLLSRRSTAPAADRPPGGSRRPRCQRPHLGDPLAKGEPGPAASCLAGGCL